MTKQGYTISQMSEISKISKKALRFYDDLGLISSKGMGATTTATIRRMNCSPSRR